MMSEQETQAAKEKIVAELLVQLGRSTEARVLAEHAKRGEVELTEEEAARIKEEVCRRAATPPGPDQSPPDQTRGREGERYEAGHATW